MAGRTTRWNRTSIVVALRKAGRERGHWIPVAQWSAEHRTPSYQTVLNVFPTWGDAWTDAGYPPPERWTRRRMHHWTDGEMFDAIRRAAMGRPLSVVGYERWHRRTKDGPSVTAIVLRFGWARARDLAGVAPPQHEALQEGEILESLVRLWRSRNRAPSRSEWVAWKDRICSYDTAQRVVGGNWEHIRARALALHPDLPQLSTRSTALLDLLKVPRESLRPRESEIASLAEGGKTLGQIGKHLHLTRERVRQIASRAARRTGVVAPKPKSSSYRPAYRGKAEMVALLRQRYDDLGHIPTVMEWNSSHWSPSVATLVTWFGSWRDAWVAALGEGHEDVQLMGKGRRHSLSA